VHAAENTLSIPNRRKFGFMNIRFSKPAPVLRSYIERYWGWDLQRPQEVHMPTISPGVGMDLFLHYKTPFATSDKGRLAQSHLLFSREEPICLLPANNIGFIAIRFRTGMFRHFCAFPQVELAHRYPDAESLWGREGRQLLQQVNSRGTFEEKASLLDKYFIQFLEKYRRPAPEWTHVVNQLYYKKDAARPDQLAQGMQLSYRHFRRRFVEETGMTPKHFQQLVRFRSALRTLLMNGERHYLSTALDNGYFDQMHFHQRVQTLPAYDSLPFLAG
jgi:AraC-like DNA-binding protein